MDFLKEYGSSESNSTDNEDDISRDSAEGLSSNLNDRVLCQVYLIPYSKADLQKFPRWKFFQFNVQIEQNDQKEIPQYARCIASLVLN